MAETSWPSPSHNSRAVTDREYEELVSAYTGDGLVGSPNDNALVYGDGTGLYVKVRADRRGLVRAHLWSSGATDFTKSITSNASGSTRNDLVVLRLTRATWNVTTEVKLGAPGAGPPALVQDITTSGYYEIPVATVRVESGATVINSADVQPAGWFLGEPRYYCTSTSRPPTVAGRRIYETNTGFEYVCVGSSWVRIADERSGAGELGPYLLSKWSVNATYGSPLTLFDQTIPCRPGHFHNLHIRLATDTNRAGNALQWYLSLNNVQVDFGAAVVPYWGAGDVNLQHLGYKTGVNTTSLRIKLTANAQTPGSFVRSWIDNPNGGVISVIDTGAGAGSGAI